MIRIVFVWLLSLTVPAMADTALHAHIDRTVVNADESFELTIETDDATLFGQPDLTSLAQDFIVLDTRQINQLPSPDSVGQAFTRWIIALQPKRAGTLTIPPLSLGANMTRPLSVQVQEASPDERSFGTSPLFIEVLTDRDEAYVQQQILLTVKLHHTVPLYNDGVLTPLQIEYAQVETLGSPLTYEKEIDGLRHGVIEQRYAIYPLRDGHLRIPPLTFGATRVDNGQPGTAFSPNERWLQQTSSAKTLRIKPIPPQYPADQPWLPARSVHLDETWSPEAEPVVIQDAITQTVILSADGLPANQLPELVIPVPSNWRRYEDAPQTRDNPLETGIQSQRTQRLAWVPERPGQYRLPSSAVVWWNTVTDRIERTALPERTWEIIAAKDQNLFAEPASELSTPSSPLWPWQLATVVMGLTTLVGFALYGRTRAASSSSRHHGQPDRQACLRTLRHACQHNDAQAARQALDSWARLQTETLADLAAQCIPLSQALDELNGSLYSETDRSWEGAGLWRAIKALPDNETHTASPAKSSLPPLYPD